MFAKDTTQCSDCDKGKYWGPDNETKTGGASLDCISCSPGTYAAGPRATSCLKCETGTYSKLAWESCIACTKGSMVLKDASGCEACPAGQYSTTDKATACIKCAKGKFISTPGATACTNCNAGGYADEDGLSECKKCPAGKFSTAIGSSSNTSCVQCTGSGYTSQAGQAVCSNCLADYAVSLGHRGECLCMFVHQVCLSSDLFTSHAGCDGSPCPRGWVPKWTNTSLHDGIKDVGCMGCGEQLPINSKFEPANAPGVCTNCKSCLAIGIEYQAARCTETNETNCLACPKCILGQEFYTFNCTENMPSTCSACR